MDNEKEEQEFRLFIDGDYKGIFLMRDATISKDIGDMMPAFNIKLESINYDFQGIKAKEQEDEENQYFSMFKTPYVPNSKEYFEAMLKEAIDNEDYEEAARLRDVLKDGLKL